jgi:hypothetical protein
MLLFIAMALENSLKLDIVILPLLLFLSALLWLYVVFGASIFSIDFSVFVMDVIGIMLGVALVMWIAFGNTAIFTILTLPIHEHGRSFYLL